MNHSKTLYSTLHIGLVRYIHDSTIHKGHLCLCSKLKSSHGWQWLRLLWLKSYLFSSRLLCVRHDDCWLCFILSKFLECNLSKYLQISSSVEILGPVWSPASHLPLSYHCTGGHFIQHGQKTSWSQGPAFSSQPDDIYDGLNFVILFCEIVVCPAGVPLCSALHCLHPASCPALPPGIISTVWSAGPAGRDFVTLHAAAWYYRDIVLWHSIVT